MNMMTSSLLHNGFVNKMAGLLITPSCSNARQFSRAAVLANRWYPQPQRVFLSHVSRVGESESAGGDLSSCTKVDDKIEKVDEIGGTLTKLSRVDAAPVYAPVPAYKDSFELVNGKGGQFVANYELWSASIKRAEIPWLSYDHMTSEERTVHMAHLDAIQARQMTYKDPFTKFTVLTVSQLLYNGKCCGNGCRHCPYNLENCSEDIKKNRKWCGAFWV